MYNKWAGDVRRIWGKGRDEALVEFLRVDLDSLRALPFAYYVPPPGFCNDDN